MDVQVFLDSDPNLEKQSHFPDLIAFSLILQSSNFLSLHYYPGVYLCFKESPAIQDLSFVGPRNRYHLLTLCLVSEKRNVKKRTFLPFFFFFFFCFYLTSCAVFWFRDESSGKRNRCVWLDLIVSRSMKILTAGLMVPFFLLVFSWQPNEQKRFSSLGMFLGCVS